MSVVSLDSPGAAVRGLNGFSGDAAGIGLTWVVGADFLLEAEGVCNIKMNESVVMCENNKENNISFVIILFSRSPVAADSDSAPRYLSCCHPQLAPDWWWLQFGFLKLEQV